MATATPTLNFACNCGAFTMKLHGEPLLCFNCQCQSCGAVCDYVEGLAGGSENKPAEKVLGNPCAFYKTDNIEPPLDAMDKLNFVKVGEGGQNVRSYTKCCNTMVQGAGGAEFPVNARPINRLNIKNEDGTPYVSSKPVFHHFVKHAFDPAVVPEPKCQDMAPGMLGIMVPMMLAKKCCCCFSSTKVGAQNACFFVDASQVTEVCNHKKAAV
jgi:hypothetical protein